MSPQESTAMSGHDGFNSSVTLAINEISAFGNKFYWPKLSHVTGQWCTGTAVLIS